MPNEETSFPQKRLLFNTAAMLLQAAVQLPLNILLSRQILHLLGVDDFGLWSVVGALSTMLIFLNGGIVEAVQRFMIVAIGKNRPDQLRKVFNTALAVELGLGGVILLLGEAIGPWSLNHIIKIAPDRIFAAQMAFQCSLLSVILLITNMPYQALLLSREKMSIPALLEIIRLILKLLILFPLFQAQADHLILYAAAMAGVDFLIMVLYALYCRMHFMETRFLWIREWKEYQKILSYSIWILFGSTAFHLKTYGTPLVINQFFASAVNAAFAIALQVGAAVNLFSITFMNASRPQIIANYAAGNVPEMFRLAFQATKVCFIIQMVICTPLFLEMRTVLDLWLTHERVPEYALIFCILMLVDYGINITAWPMMTICNATGKIRLYQTVVGGFLLLNLPLLYLILWLFPNPLWIIPVHITVTFLAMQIRLMMIKRLVYFSILNYYRRLILPMLAGTGLIYLLYLGSRFLPVSNLSRFMIDCTAAPLTAGIVLIFLILNRNERRNMIHTFRNIIHLDSSSS